MRNLAPLTLLLAGASTTVHGALLRINANNNNHHHRNLQFFDFKSSAFQLDGFPILPNDAELLCPDDWMAFVACTALECPDLVDTCPRSIFYDGDDLLLGDEKAKKDNDISPIYDGKIDELNKEMMGC